MPFGDSEAPISACSHEMLTKLYGDYMKPLPESQRNRKVHADIVDTENSYECYLEQQKNQVISEFTRSIR